MSGLFKATSWQISFCAISEVLADELALHPRSLRMPRNLVQGVPVNQDFDEHQQCLGDMEGKGNTW